MQKTTKKITVYLVAEGLIHPENRDVFAYGFEVLLSSGGFIVFALILSQLTGFFRELLVYLLAFMPIRSCIGGYHAKTPTRCQLLSLATTVLAVSAGYWLSTNIVPMLIGVALMLIFGLAPVIHPHHPFSKARKKRLKTKARIIAGTEAAAILVLLNTYPTEAKIMVCAFLLASLGMPMAIRAGQTV